MSRKWKRIGRCIFYPPFIVFAALSYIFITKYLMVLVPLIDFPEPTAFNRPVENYDPQSFGASIKAGFAKRDITPPRFSWIAGFYPPHPGLVIKDRIQVKSLALQDKNGNQVVIVSCDLIGLLPDEVDNIFSQVRLISRNKIFLSTTHTHSGPDTMGLWGLPFIGGKNKDYLRRLRREIAAAIDESVMNLQESALRFGQGEFSGYVHGRDENPADPTVSIMQVLIGSSPVTLINFASHADIAQGFQVSADFPHFLEERLHRLVGGETMFIPGAIGGVQPNFENAIDTYLVRIIGENLADEVYKILKKPILPKFADIEIKKLRVSSPLENALLLKAVRAGMISNLLNKDNLVEAEVSRIRIGPAEIITVPGELFPKIWWRAKSKMRGNPKMIFGLTNGEFGYILLPEDIKSGKHPYHVSVSVGPKFGEEIRGAMQGLAESE